MTVTALLLSLTLHAQTVDKPSLQYYQDGFLVRSHGTSTQVPIQEPDSFSPTFVAFRKNDSFAVWDDRGLTVRKGPKSVSSRLPDVAVSPHVFSRDQILNTIQRIRSGECTKTASALSGAKRIGKDTYFLIRWEDKAGKPWAEALVQVNLDDPNPQPQLLGRFEGLSMATKPIDDKLQILNGRLTIIARSDSSWGLSTYDPETQRFKTQTMGGSLLSFDMQNTTQGLFVETSAYGTHIAGRVDLETGTRKTFYEGREKVRFADKLSPEIVLATASGKTKIVNCSSSAVRLFPVDLTVKRCGSEVILYAPKSNPGVAWLEDPITWTTLATWRSKSPN